MDFKTTFSLAERIRESSRVLEKFPGRIPVIVERSASAKTIPVIDKNKFLTPSDLTVGQFCFIVRKRLTLPSEQAMFLFIGDTLPTTGTFMKELYAKYKDPEDGFLYVKYCGESTFGCFVVTV